MRQTKIIMGMPVIVDIVGDDSVSKAADAVFEYFRYVDEKFSTYKDTSEITVINKGIISPPEYSDDMKEIFMLSEKTKHETDGYFDIVNGDGKYDPSGLVKGWAIFNASKILKGRGIKNFFIDAGGDIEVSGVNEEGKPWSVGIANPFKKNYSAEAGEVVKVLQVSDRGVATSGTSARGQHIYNPHARSQDGIHDIVSLTVIGPNIYEADRFATAAFAMGRKGIEFIGRLRLGDESFEGYMIDKDGNAVMTAGFKKYTHEAVS